MSGQTNNSFKFFLLSLLALIWGSSFILMKWGLHVYSWSQVGAIRMCVSFLVMFPIVCTSFRKIERRHWKFLAITGFCGNCFPAFLFPLAETHIDSALVGIINSLTPLFTLLLGFLVFRTELSKNRILGVVIGFAGAVAIVLGNSKGIGQSNLQFSFYVILATIFYAISVNVLRHKLAEVDAVLTTGFAIMFAGIPSGIYLFTTDFISKTQTMNSAGFSLLSVTLLGLFGTAVSTFLFIRLIKSSGALFASSVTYFIPFVAILWGIGDGEKLGLTQLAGFAAILCGVYLINKSRSLTPDSSVATGEPPER
jgi:drug/metabolite transporter (DMT)-like permease